MKQFYLSLLLLGGMLVLLLPARAWAQTTESISISNEDPYISFENPMDWSRPTSRSQLYYPASMLNLPVGSQITAISFRYLIQRAVENLGTGGDIKIAVGECVEIPGTGSNGDFLNNQLNLCYNGSHQLQISPPDNYSEQTVTYQFSTPYTYQGGCLVIDISNAESPRTVTNTETRFEYSDIDEACCMDDRDNYIRNGCPDITFEFKQAGTAPILYLSYSKRKVNCGFMGAGESRDYPIQISNKGNKTLQINASEGKFVSVSSKSIAPGSNDFVTFGVKSTQEGSFKETVTVQSDGGTADLTFIGTTYQLKRAANWAEVSANKRLSAYNFDPSISELSVSGDLDREDWRYICDHFINLRYLDLSQANYFSENFPNYYFSGNRMKTWERLAFPLNVVTIDSDFFSRFQLTQIRQVILPPGLERFDANLSGCPLMHSLISLAMDPPRAYNNALDYVPTVYVPQSALSTYMNDYNWNRKQLNPISQAALDGEKSITTSLTFEDNTGYGTSNLINYRETKTHTQLFFPQKMLNLPMGSEISALTFKFSIGNPEQLKIENGQITISATEIPNMTTEPSFLPPGAVKYEGSDLLDLSVVNSTIQDITYQFTTPYIYQGGCLVFDVVSTPTKVQTDNNFWISCMSNGIEEIACLTAWQDNSPHYSSIKPNVVIDFSTESKEPILFAKKRKVLFGYVQEGAKSPVRYLYIQNPGASELNITGLSGSGRFLLEVPVTIPAHSEELIGLRFQSYQKGSFDEKAVLESNGGATSLRLIGTTYRQAPYWNAVVVTPNTSLSQQIMRADTVTALSVSGSLTDNDWSFLRYNFPALRCLDLSTATFPRAELYNEPFLSQMEQLALPMNLEEINIQNSRSLTKLILPVGIQRINNMLPEQLTTLISFSVTPPDVSNNYIKNIQTIYVPENAIENYRQTYNWYEKEIKPITDEVLGGTWNPGKRLITISDDQEYQPNNYPGGLSNIIVMPNFPYTYTASLQNHAPLAIDTLILAHGLDYRYNNNDQDLFDENAYYSSFINHDSSATINKAGLLVQFSSYTWHYLSFPFDICPKDIEKWGTWEYVFRRYDGQYRALNGIGESWKNVNPIDVLKAGSGYIFQSNSNGVGELAMMLPANSEEGIKSFLGNESRKVGLESYPSEQIENQSWNLAGNPYPSFFNIHYIKHDAPVMIWNGYGYIALSLKDDNYALRPMEAFFTQKPTDDANYYMVFAPEGRQINSYIANPVETRSSLFSNRRLINLTFSGETYSDKSRIVLNPNARMAYELTCDAVKWMSSNADIPQLYSLDDEGRQYAINERPEGSGKALLGIYVGKSGDYTLTLPEKEVGETVVLEDKYLNKKIDLTKESYTFRADKGTFNDRFELRLSGPTGIDSTPAAQLVVSAQGNMLTIKSEPGITVSIYSAAGILRQTFSMTQSSQVIPLPAGFYLVKIGENTHKIIIH